MRTSQERQDAQTGGREALHEQLSVAILAQVGIQAPGLNFRCICHPGNPIKTRFESGFCLLCTSHCPCCLSPNRQVERLVVLVRVRSLWWIWVQRWEEASQLQVPWEDLPAP